jgi:hypothetical protein
MKRMAGLYWLAAVVAVGGIVGAALMPFGQVQSCVEFAGCHTQNLTARIAIAVLGLIVSGILLTAASARKNRWRRDARYWEPTNSG